MPLEDGYISDSEGSLYDEVITRSLTAYEPPDYELDHNSRIPLTNEVQSENQRLNADVQQQSDLLLEELSGNGFESGANIELARKPQSSRESATQNKIDLPPGSQEDREQPQLPIIPDSSITTTISAESSTSDGLSTEHPHTAQTSLEENEIVNAVAIVEARSGRSLRQRTVLQLHPYTLEYELYRRSLKSRGIRPVVVPSQGKSSGPDPQLPQNSSSQQETPSQSQLYPESMGDDMNSEDIAYEENNETFGTTFSSPPPSSPIPPVSLPSKTTKGRAAKLKALDPDEHLYANAFSQGSSAASSEDEAIDRILLAKQRRRRQLFKTIARPETESHSRPNSGTDSADSSKFNSSSDSGESDSESEPELASEIELLKKKVRGVLPPSFITIDYTLQHQNKNKTNKKKTNSSTENNHKGVARKKIGNSTQRPLSPAPFGFTSSRTASPPAYTRTTPKAPSLTPPVLASPIRTDSVDNNHRPILISSDDDFGLPGQFEPLDDLVDPSDMEDDHIDTMNGPSKGGSSRNPQTRPRKRLAQSTIDGNSKDTRYKHKRPRGSVRHTNHQTRITGKSTKRRPQGHHNSKVTAEARQSQNSTTQQMSIVDLIDNSTSTERNNMPRFSLIAQRSALLKAHEQRLDSPTHKYIVINDGDESHPELKTLKRWKRGRLRQTNKLGSYSNVRQHHQSVRSDNNYRTAPTSVRERKEQSKPRRKLPTQLLTKKNPSLSVVSRGNSYYQSKSPQFRTTIIEIESGEYSVAKPMNSVRPKQYPALSPLQSISPGMRPMYPLRHENLPRTHSNSSLSFASSRPEVENNRVTREYKSKKQILRPPQRRTEYDDTQLVGDMDHLQPITSLVGAPHLSSMDAVPNRPFQGRRFYSYQFDVQPFAHDVVFATDTIVYNCVVQRPLGSKRDAIFLGNGIGLVEAKVEDHGLRIPKISEAYNRFHIWIEDCLSPEVASKDYSLDVYEFFLFVLPLVSDGNSPSYDQDFVKELSRLTLGLVADILDVWSRPFANTKMSTASSEFAQLTFTTASLCLLLLHRLKDLLKTDPTTMYSHSNAIRNLGGKLVQLIVSNFLPEVSNIMRSHRSTSNRVITRTSYILEIIYIAIHVLDNEVKGDGFYDMLNSVITLPQLLRNPEDLDSVERVWHSVFIFSAVYKLPKLTLQSNWKLVNILQGLTLTTFDSPGQQTLAIPYQRVFLVRCLKLATDWKWENNPALCISIYKFFAGRRFSNIEPSVPSGLSPFLSNGNFTEVVTTDSAYNIFLKLVAWTICFFQGDDNRLRKFIGILTPLNGRLYPMSSGLKVTDLDALGNQYSLLLVQFKYGRPSTRPTIDHFRSFIVLEQSHILARNLSLEAWFVVTKLLLEQDMDLDDTMKWFAEIVDSALKDTRKTGRYTSNLERELDYQNVVTYQKFFEKAVVSIDKLVSNQAVISKSRQWMNLLTPCKYRQIP
ncbi:DNA repair protein Mus7/Mms22 [Sugiyamaella lignohabitans]|uniref:DNA repair protein Mus7/Mms22 n=1 Tax=Sugiyamaella lignohabitans TaxID=796027 RepID=A0A167EYV1_9ASCO|nr:DNA repair protein Mus7/Mms22 [Sugiyamaella lignohabitans]ANB14621.1 DNA repair protein Mus7/Mms22 [Sugiyamaella lignohabitans]